MKSHFQINLSRQFYSASWALVLVGLGPIAILIADFIGKLDSNFFLADLINYELISLVFISPAIYLHLIYLTQNWNTHLTIDQNEIEIQNTNGVFKYQLFDIKSAILNLGIFYKNRIDKRGRWVIPWTNYGYFKLELKDGKEFIFTSLMVDLEKLEIPVTSARFRFLPLVEEKPIGYKEIRSKLQKLKQAKIDEYQERFQDLSDEELLGKINSGPKFEFEARQAAQRILEFRRKITTANKVHKNSMD